MVTCTCYYVMAESSIVYTYMYLHVTCENNKNLNCVINHGIRNGNAGKMRFL